MSSVPSRSGFHWTRFDCMLHMHTCINTNAYMIPGTKPDAIPAGFPPPNHFFVALKIERWRPLRETI